MDPEEFRIPSGTEIRTVRQDLGLSRRDVSRQCDITHNTLRAIEVGDSGGRVPTLRDIVEVLKMEHRKQKTNDVQDK